MASPFPGIDPYFEAEFATGDFRATFIVTLSEFLNETLPENYVSRISERTYLVDPDFTLPSHHLRRGSSSAAPDTTDPEYKPIKVPDTVFLDPYKELFLDVLRLPDQKVVTIVEEITPTNKAGGRGQYLERRQRLMNERVNLVEIDLSRGGLRPLFEYEFRLNSYCFLISRAADRRFTEVYEWSVQDPIPKLPVPLSAGERATLIDLGQLLHVVRERGRYDRWIDYNQLPPAPAFEGEERDWVEQMAARAKK